ncbi:MAG: DUF998 domain-containing protein [Pyrinomonadaceae bacterium]
MQKVLSKDIIFGDTNITKPVMAISPGAAYISFAAAAIFLVLLTVLHIIKPEFDPSWRFVSEYAIGRHGWVMVLAFLFLALSCLSSDIAIRSQIGTTGGKIGLALLVVVAVALVAAGIFVADPITASKDELTTHGSLHGLAAMIGIPGLPIAAVLISRSLGRNEVWSSSRRLLLWTAHLTWISVLVMFVSMFIMLGQTQGKFGPNVLIGLPNRLVVLAYCVWLMVIAWRASQVSHSPNATK